MQGLARDVVVLSSFLSISVSALAANNTSKQPINKSLEEAPSVQQLHGTMSEIARSRGLVCDPWKDKHCLDEFKEMLKKKSKECGPISAMTSLLYRRTRLGAG